MKNIRHIFMREFLERVRTKAFIITTILTPLLMGGVILLPMYFAVHGSNQKTRVVVAETGPKAGAIYELMRQRQSRDEEATKAGAAGAAGGNIETGIRQAARASIELRSEKVQPGREAETRAQLEKDVLANRIDALLWIEGDPAAGGKAEYAARSVTDFAGVRGVQNLLSAAVVQQRLETRGLDPREIESLVKPIEMDTIRPSQSGARKESGLTGYLSSYVFVMVLYMTLLMWGITVMRGVMEEKSSRVFEVLLSAAKPFELMAGKIFGIGAVGMLQYTIWAGLAALVGGGSIRALRQLGQINIPGEVLFFLVLFFILGFFLYATMYAAVGAMVNSDQEAQQVQMLVMMCLLIPLIMMPAVLRAPSSTLATVLSLVPVFTPILMLARITLVSPPFWQVALSIVLLLLTNLAVVWVAARIYRVGILMYGKRPTLPEIVRWVRAA